MISKQTAQFLLGIVSDLRPYSGAEDFREATEAIIRAQDELRAVLDESPSVPASLEE